MKFRPVPRERRRRRTLRVIAQAVLAVALVVAAGSVLVACTIETGTTSSSASPITTEAPPSTTESAGGTQTTGGASPSTTAGGGGSAAGYDGGLSPAQVVAGILGPSVVNIGVSGTIEVTGFGPFGPQEQQYSGEGSGVIYTADGLIITNNHVVTDSYGDPVDNLEVTFTTGEKLPATIVGTDPLTDLAVIKVQTDLDLPVAVFQNAQPSVGEYAIAIGSPLGFENSVTLGVVSGLARSIEGVQGNEGVALTNLIQTDAPISPGNSGGALANAAGEVIGINVAYLPATTGAVNIGFAIPAVVATQVADQIISTGKATHAYIGVGTQTVTTDLQRQFGLSRGSGILVAEVTPSGPAGKAGIQQGDIIIAVDGKTMVESSDLLIAIRDKLPGDRVEVTVDRDGREMTITVTLEERPADL